MLILFYCRDAILRVYCTRIDMKILILSQPKIRREVSRLYS